MESKGSMESKGKEAKGSMESKGKEDKETGSKEAPKATQHQHNHHRFRLENPKRLLCTAILSLIGLLVVALVLLCIINGGIHAPKFILQNTSVYALNLSNLNSLTSSMQLNIASTNRNKHMGFQYETLAIHASFQHQTITAPGQLQPAYVPPHYMVGWTLLLKGDGIPISPFEQLNLIREVEGRMVGLSIRVHGKLRWKLSYMSFMSHLFVDCPISVALGCEGCGDQVTVNHQQGCNVQIN